MKETTPPKDPKKKLWIGYAVIIAILFACNLFLFPAMMQAKVKSVNYSTFLQMLENKQLSTVQIEDQQIYFVDNENNSYKTNAIAQDNNLVTRLEDAGVEFGTVYQSPTIWDSLLNLAISLLPMILLFWWLNRYIGKKMQSMGGANSMLFGGGKSGAKQYVVDDKTGIKFNDVAGEDEAKESLQEIVDFLNNPQKYEDIGAKMPKGVLLVGPPGTGKTLLANAAEELCFHYAKTSKLQVKVFRLPYLYAVSASGAEQFARLFEQISAGTVQMDEQAAQPLLALCAEELADLVARVFDTWTPEPERFTLPDVFGSTQGQLGEALQKLQPGLKVLYGTDTIQTYPAADNTVRRRYGWFQRYSLLDDLPTIYNMWCARQAEKKSFIRKTVDKIRQSPRLLQLIEIAAAWFVTELLVRITGTDAQFQMIDFRLMFVVLVGTVYGLNAGVLSAVLASVSLAAGYLRQGTTLMLLFYEPANWLAFIVYFVVGASCGYVQLRNTETARFVQEENKLLCKRLEFTRKLYQDTLEDKQMFRRQILGRRDSFGKIYAVTQQLDMLQPQEIYRKTVQVMEDVLENHSLPIYRMEKNHGFARLTAASAGMTPEPAHSLEVEQWLDVLRAIEQEGLWVNRGFLPGRPMYAAGVRQNGSLVVLIGLYTAGEEQMTLYYQNLFRILCGLVETALVRAFAYESAVRENWYLPGTCLLRPAVFAEQLATACTLQEDKMAHHLLLRVTGEFKDRAELNDRVERSIRSTDAAGVGTDNEVYLLMNQADEEDLPLLTRRLGEKGLCATAVPLDEQLRLIDTAKQEGPHA